MKHTKTTDTQEKRPPCHRSTVFYICLVFLLLPAIPSRANMPKISVSMSNVPLKEILTEIEQLSGHSFIYNNDLINTSKIVSLEVKNESITDALAKLFTGGEIIFQVVGKHITLAPASLVDTRASTTNTATSGEQAPAKDRNLPTVREVQAAQQTSKTVAGKITDSSGAPLPGTSIVMKGTTIGVSSGREGTFRIEMPDDDCTLVFSFIGMCAQEVAVGHQTVINVILIPEEEFLDEVIVTGYQTISKERATGSFFVVKGKAIENKTETDLMSRLEGFVPGMSNDGVSQNPQITIRGTSTIKANKSPLYVVDGIPYEGQINLIQPSDVVNVTVLKDAAAASIYGARAANGVIVITTRQGKSGKMRVRYNGSIHLTPLPSLEHMNLMNSAELVDYKLEVFNTVTPGGISFKDYYTSSWNDRTAMDPVLSLLVAKEKGKITDAVLQSGLNKYRNMDNRKQLKDEFARTAMVHRHNIGISGGGRMHDYLLSLNYTGNNRHDKLSSSEQYGFNSKNNINFSEKISAYLYVSSNFTKQKDKGGNLYNTILRGYPSYFMIRDQEGNPLQFSRNKSEEEINRLKNIGLLDESYYPINESGKELWENNGNYFRIQGGLNWIVSNVLVARIKYQTEFGNRKDRLHYLHDSYFMRNSINDAAQIDKTTGQITHNVPLGGRLEERREDTNSYTLRMQLDYDKTFRSKHYVSAIAGAERRAVRATSIGNVFLGYDENGLKYTHFNPDDLSRIYGTEAIDGFYGDWETRNKVYVNESENRYVSFYGNASYDYDSRYLLTGSVRVDQSNLFGTDPKYQYKPLWSFGGSWQLHNEKFMGNTAWVNNLTVRATYGIGGNVSSGNTPFILIYSQGTDQFTGGNSAYIRTPPNPQLRWERTGAANIGLNYSLFNSRLNGSIELYNKRTSDMLGEKKGDPTLGWYDQPIVVNYGEMYNRGIEFSLNPMIINNRNFSWNANFIFSYNKNKLLTLEGTSQTVDMFLYPGVLTEGKPVNAIYSSRYAGLNNRGESLYYNAEGEKVLANELSSLDDLVYSGTFTPKYTASLINNVTWRNLELSFKLLFYGGHVIRDQGPGLLTGFEYASLNRDAVNHWRAPGDEKKEGLMPSINPRPDYFSPLAWKSRDSNIKKGDYIKLRDVNLTYHIPKNLLDKYGIESLSVSLQADELWWWAANGRIDPEAHFYVGNGTYSLTSRKPVSYSLGLNINF